MHGGERLQCAAALRERGETRPRASPSVALSPGGRRIRDIAAGYRESTKAPPERLRAAVPRNRSGKAKRSSAVLSLLALPSRQVRTRVGCTCACAIPLGPSAGKIVGLELPTSFARPSVGWRAVSQNSSAVSVSPAAGGSASDAKRDLASRPRLTRTSTTGREKLRNEAKQSEPEAHLNVEVYHHVSQTRAAAALEDRSSRRERVRYLTPYYV